MKARQVPSDLRMSGAIVGNGRLHFRYVIDGDNPRVPEPVRKGNRK